jgi:flagellar motor switch protein FliM
MSDILSNEEINALLSAYRAAESQGRGSREKQADQQVRLYDFARPDKFSRDHIRTLHSIHNKYATGFSITLAALLHVAVQADLLCVDQVTYREYCTSVPENTLFCDVSLEPLTGTAIFEFNPPIAGACVDGLTGGSGIAFSHDSDLTEIDRASTVKVIETLLKKYEEAWAPYIGLKAAVREADLLGSFNQTFLPSEPVLVCAYEVRIGQTVGMMSVCIPAAAVEAILPNLSAGRTVSASSRQTPAVADALQESLQDVEMQCTAILGRTTLSMGEIVNLREGDIIRLETGPESEIEFWVGDTKTGLAIPGRSGRRLGLRVTRLAKNARKAA